MSDPADVSLTSHAVAPRKRGGTVRLDTGASNAASNDPSIPVVLRLPMVDVANSARSRQRSRSAEAESSNTQATESGSRARRRGSEPPTITPLATSIAGWFKTGGVILASILAFFGAYYFFTRSAKTPNSADAMAKVDDDLGVPVISPPEPAPLKKHDAAPIGPRIADARPNASPPNNGGPKPEAKPTPPQNPAPHKPAPQNPEPAKPNPPPAKPNPAPAPNPPAPQNPAPQKPNPAPAPAANPNPNPAPAPAPNPNATPLTPAPPPQNPPAQPAPAPPAQPTNPYPSTGAPAHGPPLPTVIERQNPVNVPAPLIVPNPMFRAGTATNPPAIRTADAAPAFTGPTYPRTDPNTYWFRPDRPAPEAAPAANGNPNGNRAGTAELGPMIDSPSLRSR